MTRFFLIIISALILCHLMASASFAQTQRYATCDLCGLCITTQAAAAPLVKKPQNWNSCKACLYPEAVGEYGTVALIPDPSDPSGTAFIPPSTKRGNYFTMVGCLRTNMAEGFSQEGAAGGIVQQLLNIVFSTSGGIAFLYLLYGAFLVLTSQADPGRLNHGRRTIYGSLIGIVFVIGAIFIINVIGGDILKIPGFGR